MEVCIIKNTIGIALNSELKFQKYMNIAHSREKVHMLNIF